jgi:methylenetetrahydrofolate reductase (NADPH)
MTSVTDLLARPRFEVIPLNGTEEAVVEHVPTDVTVTVTTSPAKGLEPTLALTERLAEHGYRVVPHVAARHVRDRGHLAELVERLRATGASDVLVLAGDAEEPAGDFDGSLPLLQALAELGQPFRDVGITGYPESHALISDAVAVNAMFAKEEFSTYISQSICFDPEVTAAWMRAVWGAGTRLPSIGLSGAVPRTRSCCGYAGGFARWRLDPRLARRRGARSTASSSRVHWFEGSRRVSGTHRPTSAVSISSRS